MLNVAAVPNGDKICTVKTIAWARNIEEIYLPHRNARHRLKKEEGNEIPILASKQGKIEFNLNFFSGRFLPTYMREEVLFVLLFSLSAKRLWLAMGTKWAQVCFAHFISCDHHLGKFQYCTPARFCIHGISFHEICKRILKVYC